MSGIKIAMADGYNKSKGAIQQSIRQRLRLISDLLYRWLPHQLAALGLS
jgi:hypothetical protein